MKSKLEQTVFVTFNIEDHDVTTLSISFRNLDFWSKQGQARDNAFKVSFDCDLITNAIISFCK